MSATPLNTRNVMLGAIAATSIVSGLYVTYMAVHAEPKPQFYAWGQQALSALRRDLGLTPSGRFFSSKSPMIADLEKFYLFLVRIFQDLVSTPFGKGAFLFIFSMTAPLMLYANVEALKPEAHLLMGGLAVLVIFSTGQLICIGAALPIMYIPAYALVRALRPRDTFPQRAFNESAIPLLSFLQLVCGVPALLTLAVPPKHNYFFLVNTLFQFFPLLLIHLPGYKMFASRNQSVSSTAVGDLFRTGRISTTLLYWAGMFFMYPTLVHLARGSWLPLSDAVKLILWDSLGVILSMIYIVCVDLVADPVPAGMTSRRNVHNQGETLLVGTVKAVITSIIFGPGTAMNSYFAKREDAVASVHPGYEIHIKEQ
ncbi:hypothetical protein MYAM1_001220 [Malassezia yamatoensis]|uniref:Uncharacterized protein n=1 Tax=Malassezia yamatoensis TaxID=253288 RepID=A0AAJ5YRN1_9BASI|nr:hypothetical protein MYAM1_001220 [Malassezia yamatoensis]